MVKSEQEMLQQLAEAGKREERFTSLQPTYEDSIPPAPDSDWELEQD